MSRYFLATLSMAAVGLSVASGAAALAPLNFSPLTRHTPLPTTAADLEIGEKGTVPSR